MPLSKINLNNFRSFKNSSFDLSKKNLIGFYKTLQKSEGKIGVVVSFLASLELAKDGCVDLIQNNNEEIYIKSKVLNAVNE